MREELDKLIQELKAKGYKSKEAFTIALASLKQPTKHKVGSGKKKRK